MLRFRLISTKIELLFSFLFIFRIFFLHFARSLTQIKALIFWINHFRSKLNLFLIRIKFEFGSKWRTVWTHQSHLLIFYVVNIWRRSRPKSKLRGLRLINFGIDNRGLEWIKIRYRLLLLQSFVIFLVRLKSRQLWWLSAKSKFRFTWFIFTIFVGLATPKVKGWLLEVVLLWLFIDIFVKVVDVRLILISTIRLLVFIRL